MIYGQCPWNNNEVAEQHLAEKLTNFIKGIIASGE
jgi:hypothetical protein